MGAFPRHIRWLWVAAVATVAALALLIASALTTDTAAQAGSRSLSQLNSALGANQATQADLAADVRSLDGQVSSLDRQISLVRSREADVQAQLTRDRATLAGTRTHLAAETRRLALLRRALRHAQTVLSAQLVSSYEQPQTSLISVVLSSHGFTQLLDQIQFLSDAEHSQQHVVSLTTRAKAATTTAARHLSTLQHTQSVITAAATTQVNALAGMNSLLSSREAALRHIESARDTALANARAKGSTLRSAIAAVKAQQAAAARAAAKAAAAAAAAAASAASTSSPDSSYSGPTPSGGWAIPAAIVLCESGGQNLPPNSAGASGYYQIIPATWTGEGGSGPAAYLAPKSEQDAIAAKLWDGGAGARNWVCAAIVGIT